MPSITLQMKKKKLDGQLSSPAERTNTNVARRPISEYMIATLRDNPGNKKKDPP